MDTMNAFSRKPDLEIIEGKPIITSWLCSANNRARYSQVYTKNPAIVAG
jgi:hypothetical protein